MEKKRIFYLDIAKGIGIILVVLGHVMELSTPVRQFVTSFHMPLFFVISGYIISATNEDDKDVRLIGKHKLRSLMLPYAVFSFLSLLVEVLYIILVRRSALEVFWEHLFATVCLAGASVFWFLPALFFGTMIFVVIRKRTSAPVCGIIIAALTVLAYLGLGVENEILAGYGDMAWVPYVRLFFNMIFRMFFAAAYVTLGYFLQQAFRHFSAKAVWNLLAGGVLLALTAALSAKNGLTDMNYLVFNNILLYSIASVSGSLGILFLSRGLERWYRSPLLRVCRYYGRNSLVVMMTHTPFYIMYVASRLTAIVGSRIPLGQVLYCFMTVCLVLLFEVAVIEVINRYFPFLLGVKKAPERTRAADVRED